MSCEKYQKLISDWLDGNINQREKEKLAKHLKTCKLCRTYHEELKIINHQAKNLPEPEYLPEYWASFEENLKRKLEQIAGTEQGGKKSIWFSLPVPAGALAGILLGVAIFFAIFFLKNGQNQDLQLAMMLSYEESYLNLSQVMAEDETLAKNFNDELVNSIIQEIMVGDEEMVSPEIQNYQMQNIEENEQNNLLTENISFLEGL